jgi:hypothetical protein
MGRIGAAQRRTCAPAAKRRFYGMFTQVGGSTAGVLSGLTFLGVTYTIGEHSPTFLHWMALPVPDERGFDRYWPYVRLNIDETPVFAEERTRHLVANRTPKFRTASTR